MTDHAHFYFYFHLHFPKTIDLEEIAAKLDIEAETSFLYHEPLRKNGNDPGVTILYKSDIITDRLINPFLEDYVLLVFPKLLDNLDYLKELNCEIRFDIVLYETLEEDIGVAVPKEIIYILSQLDADLDISKYLLD